MHTYGMTPDGRQIILERFDGGVQTVEPGNADREHRFIFLDVETTGLRASHDKIIELAAALVDVNVDSGHVVRHHRTVSWMQDPGEPLSDEIVKLTGITDDDVRGKAIPEDEVRDLFSDVKLVVTHNAAFDRGFCVARFPWMTGEGMPMWACSLNQVEWRSKYGRKHADLETLAMYHGFFYGAHRATIDVEAMIRLLQMAPEPGGTPYLCDIIEDVRRSYALVAASGTPFEARDELKARGYSWDPQNKFWYTSITDQKLDDEVSWVQALCSRYGRGRPMKAPLPRSRRFDGEYRPQWLEV